MNNSQILDLLEDLHLIYGNAISLENPERLLRVWSLALSDCNPEKVEKNFKEYIQHSPYPPKPADMAKDALKTKRPELYKRNLEDGEGLPI